LTIFAGYPKMGLMKAKRKKKPVLNKKKTVKAKHKALKPKLFKIKKKLKAKKIESKKPEALPAKSADIFEGVHKSKIRIVGIGGGGGSIISGIASKIKKADFIAANTDARALRSLNNKIKKFQFGMNLTKGLGTGMNVQIGETAAEEDKERIKKLFEGQDLCIIISCLGNGTGTGATSVFAKLAKSAGCLTYGIFTLPFVFEGEKKAELAREALQKVKPYFNIFSVIPNEGIFQIIDKNTPLQDALWAINERLVNNLEGLIEMIFSVGLINIDFADLKAVLSGYGKLTYLNAIELDEAHKEEAARKLASTPLYPYTFKGAKGILYNVVGGKNLSLSDVHKISDIISEYVNKNAKIIFGINQNANLLGKLKITLLAAGCGAKAEFINAKEIKEEKTASIKRKKRKKPVQKKEAIIRKKKKPSRKKTKKINAQQPAPSKEEIKLPIVKIEEKNPVQTQLMAEQKIRRTALEVKKVAEEEEKELLERESIWETPAILRRKEK